MDIKETPERPDEFPEETPIEYPEEPNPLEPGYPEYPEPNPSEPDEPNGVSFTNLKAGNADANANAYVDVALARAFFK